MSSLAAMPPGGSPGSSAGSWVAERLGVTLTVGHDPATYGRQRVCLDSVEVGLRRNPRRAQLLVSRLLGKHIPVPVGDVLHAGQELGVLVREACGGATPLVVGFAETATGLGHAVASVAALDGRCAPYLHTTRRPPAGHQIAEFLEEHSHATDQKLVTDRSKAGLLRSVGAAAWDVDAPLVLVDDEISTGRTAVNAIRALQQIWPRRRYVLASLLDSRTGAQSAEVAAAVLQLGSQVRSVTLLNGQVTMPPTVLKAAGTLLDELPPAVGADEPRAPVTRWTLPSAAAAEVRAVATLGWDERCERALQARVTAFADLLPVHRDGRTLVLGDEELMYLPQQLAAALGRQVHTSTTTRSPAAAVDAPGYPLRTALTFRSTDGGSRVAYAYNVAPSRHSDPGNAPGFDDIVLVTDTPPSAATEELLTLLRGCARRSVHLVHVPDDQEDLRAAQ